MKRITLSGPVARKLWWLKTINYEDVKTELDNSSGDIEIYINTFGGDVYEGIDIYNLIRQYSNSKGKVTTVAMSKVMSIGTLILLAGDTIKAHKNSTVMCHNAWTWGVGNRVDFERTMNNLIGIDNILAEEYKVRQSDKTLDQILDDMTKEMWFVGRKQIEESGFVDEIIEDTSPYVEGETSNTNSSDFLNFVEEFKAKALEMKAKVDFDHVESTLKACGGQCSTSQEEPRETERPEDAVTTNRQGDSMTIEEIQAKYDEAQKTIKSLRDDLATAQGDVKTKEGDVKALQEQVTALKADDGNKLDRDLAKEFVAIASNNNLSMVDTLALFDNDSMASAMVMAKEKAQPLASGASGAFADSTPSGDGDEATPTKTKEALEKELNDV